MDMKNKNWYGEFPEVPEHVHQTVLSTLAGLDDRKVKKVKRMKKNKIIILAAAMTAVLGMTVSASEIFKWNKQAQEVFEAEKKKKKALEEHIPIIMDDTLAVMEKYLKESKPEKILEIGTAVRIFCYVFYELFSTQW